MGPDTKKEKDIASDLVSEAVVFGDSGFKLTLPFTLHFLGLQ
jgi:hypothetical protein